jgi:hypothetical protein
MTSGGVNRRIVTIAAPQVLPMAVRRTLHLAGFPLLRMGSVQLTAQEEAFVAKAIGREFEVPIPRIRARRVPSLAALGDRRSNEYRAGTIISLNFWGGNHPKIGPVQAKPKCFFQLSSARSKRGS